MAEAMMIANLIELIALLVAVGFSQATIRLLRKDRDHWREAYFRLEDIIMEHTTSYPFKIKPATKPERAD